MDQARGRLIIYLVGLAAIFLVLAGIRGTAVILNPILLAAVITIAVLPVPSWLSSKGLPGWLSLVLTIVLVVLVLVLLIGTMFFSVTQLATDVPDYVASADEQAADSIAATIGSELAQRFSSVSRQIGPIAQGLLVGLLQVLGQFGLALFIFFFMISAAMSMPGAARLGLDPNAPSIARIADLTGVVRRYLGVLTGVNFLVGFGDTILLLILGVDHAVLWGLLAWFLGYIPSVGFILALIPPLIVAYAQYGAQTAAIVLVGYILINGGVQNLIQPRIMGQSLKIAPVVVFIGLVVWTFLLGGVGAILAVPLTLLVLIILENFEGTRSLSVLLRYTGEDGDSEERRRALESIKGTWARFRGDVPSNTSQAREPEHDESQPPR